LQQTFNGMSLQEYVIHRVKRQEDDLKKARVRCVLPIAMTTLTPCIVPRPLIHD
jgi:hypothetical protein